MANEKLRKEYLEHIADRVTPITWGYYDWLENEVTTSRAQLAAARAEYETSALENMQMCEQLRGQLDAARQRIAELEAVEQERAEFVRKTTGQTGLEHLIVRYQELEAAERWIPVGERLPELGTPVMSVTSYGKMDIVCLWDDGHIHPQGLVWRNWMRAEHSNGNVTHWRPLPSGPGEVSGE